MCAGERHVDRARRRLNLDDRDGLVACAIKSIGNLQQWEQALSPGPVVARQTGERGIGRIDAPGAVKPDQGGQHGDLCRRETP